MCAIGFGRLTIEEGKIISLPTSIQKENEER